MPVPSFPLPSPPIQSDSSSARFLPQFPSPVPHLFLNPHTPHPSPSSNPNFFSSICSFPRSIELQSTAAPAFGSSQFDSCLINCPSTPRVLLCFYPPLNPQLFRVSPPFPHRCIIMTRIPIIFSSSVHSKPPVSACLYGNRPHSRWGPATNFAQSGRSALHIPEKSLGHLYGSGTCEVQASCAAHPMSW